MSRWTRRDVLKTGLSASAGALAGRTLHISGAAASEKNDASFIPEFTKNQSSPRERLLLDFGWRFQFGHANDPAKDFGLGARRREAQFAKSGNFLPVTRLDFKDADWRELDLPHDWAVELPFTDAPLVFITAPSRSAASFRKQVSAGIGAYSICPKVIPANASQSNLTGSFATPL